MLQTEGNMPTQKPFQNPTALKVRALKASTKNSGLTRLTPPTVTLKSSLKQKQPQPGERAQSERKTS